ncbi:hypothetical protein WJX84_003333 [Apatococcus fuscideae]|uniref:Uncharacterized protein n=1 Tax=Apatococcus fuscideae TaxID=2026836 RepID=A0AAW1TDH8_9CHLO
MEMRSRQQHLNTSQSFDRGRTLIKVHSPSNHGPCLAATTATFVFTGPLYRRIPLPANGLLQVGVGRPTSLRPYAVFPHRGIKLFVSVAGRALPDKDKFGRDRRFSEKPIWRHKKISIAITHCRTPEEVLDIVDKSLGKFDHICLSGAMHKLATTKHLSHHISDLLLDAAFANLQAKIYRTAAKLPARDLSTIIWAFATLESVPEDGLFQKLAECLQEKAEEASAQNIAMSVWGFGRLAEHGATLRQEGGTLQVLAMAAKGSIDTFAPKGLSMMVVGCAKLAWHDQALLNAIATAAIESQNALGPQTLANIAWACRELRYYNAPLMDAIAQRACDVFQELTGQELAMIMMALASQDHTISPAVLNLIQHVADHLQEADLNTQALTSVLWAMAIMQVCTPQMWMIFLARLEQLGPEMIVQKDWAQFYQAYLLAKVDLPSLDLHQDHSARAQYLQQEIAAARARRAQQ